jgi:ABC-type multidrug transport system ATPase subunit
MSPVITIENVSKRFGGTTALDAITAAISPGRITGLVGPDGAGKSTLLRLICGLLVPDSGSISVCGLDTVREAPAIHAIAAYMPQRFGLYEDLSVRENLDLYADLRGVVGAARRDSFARLLAFTDLERFQDRLAGQLSGGMKQKLGLACALVHTPEVLLLDEPSVGVDPISRRELWRMVEELIERGIAVLWSTSYLDEAERCADVLLLHDGRLLHAGPPARLTERVAGRAYLVDAGAEGGRAALARMLRLPGVADGVVQGRAVRLVMAEGAAPPSAQALGVSAGTDIHPVPPRFEDAYVAELGGAAPEPRDGTTATPRPATEGIAIEARGLTKQFGAFTAVQSVSFAIRRGEVFGLLGPNGAGKSTTFKMMCGLMRPSSGAAFVEGLDLYRAGSVARGRIGYMAQKFSLYGDLSVRQNLEFFSGIYGLSGSARRAALAAAREHFGLDPYIDATAGDLPLGFKQRLALACAIMHDPVVLFLDEPTSGVDPLTRRRFWHDINAMVERGVTIMVTTHFLDEAEYCDRIALVYRGRIIATGSPDELKRSVRTAAQPHPTLEDAFISLVEHDTQDAAA